MKEKAPIGLFTNAISLTRIAADARHACVDEVEFKLMFLKIQEAGLPSFSLFGFIFFLSFSLLPILSLIREMATSTLRPPVVRPSGRPGSG